MTRFVKTMLLYGIMIGVLNANDMSIGGHGATLIPLKNNQIAMKHEHILISGQHLSGPYAQRA